MVPYRTPRSSTAGSRVNSPRKAGSAAMQPTMSTSPWTADSASPWVAAVLARSFSPAPRWKAIRAFIPTPNPMAAALTKFWIG